MWPCHATTTTGVWGVGSITQETPNAGAVIEVGQDMELFEDGGLELFEIFCK